MKLVTKEALLIEIDRIIKKVKEDKSEFSHVCCHAEEGPFRTEIVAMVERHIGDCFTMDGFLAGKDIHNPDGVGNAYRILMLENMKKMVQKEYK